MRIVPLLAAAALGAALLTPAKAADLAAVPRSIAKEPKYAGKPLYCLLALGTEAKTRVWVVRDGNTVYIDRNGNGDLTEADEKVVGTPEVDDGEEMKSTITEFTLGDLPKVGDKQPYAELSMRHFRFEAKVNGVPKLPATEFASISVTLGKGAAHQGSSQSAGLAFAEKAADAPIVHFDGPLTLRIPPNAKNEPSTFLKFPGADAEGEQTITVQMGTLSPVGGTWAPLGYELVGEDVHPQAEITYAPLKAGDPPIVVKFALDGRC